MGTPRIRHCADTGYLPALLCITATFEQISALLVLKYRSPFKLFVLTAKIDELLLLGGSVIYFLGRARLVDPSDPTVDSRLPNIIFTDNLTDRFPGVIK